MKKIITSILVVAPVAFALSGCVIAVNGDEGHGYSIDFEDREYENKSKIAKLSPNMSYSHVVDLMGVADFNETYNKNNESIQVLFYRTNRKHKDGLTTKDECTPLVFKNNVLVSWGEMAYHQL
jgi:hypothetical protein